MEVPLKLEFPYDAAIPFLGIYLEKMLFQKDPNNHVFIEVLFTIAKTWKQPNCPLTDEQIKKRRCGTYIQWNTTQPLRILLGH